MEEEASCLIGGGVKLLIAGFREPHPTMLLGRPLKENNDRL